MSEWSELMNDALRAAWAEGLSAAACGRRLGVSKNAVIGKVRRLGLPARPSPIRYSGEPRVYRPRLPRAKPTLPPLPVRPPVVVVQLAPMIAVRPPAPPPRPYEPCQWPMWGAIATDGRPLLTKMARDERPGTSPRFCDAAVTFGCYCGTHWIMSRAHQMREAA